ncbi:MAG TPA: alpha/beta hydrolase [Caulobacteraceae bacterium]|nr:alpha/beta hydrolase [Caulobacteraceae bacterium]
MARFPLLPFFAAALASACAAPEPQLAPEPVAAAPAATPAKVLTFRELLQRPRGTADARIPYGADPLQFVDLWRPAGPGPHPVVVVIHGGCWRADLPGVELTDYMAEDLRRRGIAVWNVEYRRVGHPGGAYPGTFQDVGAAIDLLRAEAPRRGLKLDRVVAVGHSAGGHLALWAAGRSRLPAASPLRASNPLPIHAVVGLSAIPDLEAYGGDPADACGADTVEKLLGPARPGRYADTSPVELLPLGVPQVIVHGELERISPPSVGRAWVAKASAAGDRAELVVAPGAGHFEPIAPGAPAWEDVARRIEGLLR